MEEIDGFNMIKRMAAEVQVMMQHKIDAIKRIMELAENIALDHQYDKDMGKRLKQGGFSYNNAKKLNVLDEEDDSQGDEYERYLSQYRDKQDEYYRIGYSRMVLTANKHFSGIPVNTSQSTVHVPTNVFDGEPKVINAIDWSRKLDEIFKDNYERDPSLSWQYFGSSTGFLRQYPAMKWLTEEDDPDMYDARMRDWYIKAAASPKVIFLSALRRCENNSIKTKLVFLLIIASLCPPVIIGTFPPGHCHPPRHLRLNDRAEEGDCQARGDQYHGHAGGGRLRHRPHFLR